jgi:hypothetical protein
VVPRPRPSRASSPGRRGWVDADAERQPAELRLVVDGALLHLERGANRALRVVAVRDGCAEHGHEGISDHLVDEAVVALDHGAELRHARVDDLLQILGVLRLRDVRETGDIGEQDGGQPPFTRKTSLGRHPGERVAAVAAELRAREIGGAARRARL